MKAEKEVSLNGQRPIAKGKFTSNAATLTLGVAIALGGGAFAADVPVSLDGNLSLIMGEANESTGQSSLLLWAFEEVDGSGNPTGPLYSLGQSDKVAGIDPGSTIRVTGTLRDETLLIPDAVSILAPPSGGPTCATGDNRAIIIIANFTDKSAPCSNSQVFDVVFNSALSNTVKKYYDEDSFGTHNFFGDVAGPYTINYNSTSGSCGATNLAKLADQAATSAGYNLSNYKHRIYVFPTGPGSECSYGGLSTGPAGKPLRAWAFGTCDHHVFAHEYGHNLGMGHAGVPGDAYADKSDTMGPAIIADATGLRHNHGAHKFSTCFVPTSRVITNPGNGTATIGDLARNIGGQSQVIRVTAVSGSGKYTKDYYFSFRRPSGFDGSLPMIGPEHVDRTSIHLFQTTLSDANWNPTSELVGFIGDNEAFRDYAKGITIRQVSHTADAATVEVTIGTPTQDVTPPPAPAAPVVSGTRWVYLSWPALPSGSDFRGFRVYRNNAEIGKTPYLSFVDRNTERGRTYVYYLRSYDDAGNLSVPGPNSQPITIP